jgi:phospholipid transport system substrate-binding protein
LEKENTMQRVVQAWSIALLSVVWISGLGWAATGEPTALIKQTTTQVLGILEDPRLQGPEKREERHERLLQIADAAFDWEGMARSALAIHWRQLTAQQQQEFVQLFRELVERAYMGRLEDAVKQEKEILYTGEQEQSSQTVVVTKVITKRDQEVSMDYYLHKQDGRWLIDDVIIEGVGLVDNYRSQISEILSSSSYDALIQRMKAKVAEETSRRHRPTPLGS